MKRFISIALVVVMLLMLVGCKHEHVYSEATCTEPSTCSVCGHTERSALGHDWEPATCAAPETCAVCGETNGDVLEHTWVEATCETGKHCSECGLTQGEALGHNMEEATCTTPKTCTVCGKTFGTSLGHHVEESVIIKDATCLEAGLESGTCAVCGETVEKTIAKLPHTPGEAEISSVCFLHGTCTATRTVHCTACGKQIKSQRVVLSDEERNQWLKETCTKTYSYDDIARNPEAYVGKYAYFTGEVVQVIPGSDGEDTLRVSITREGSYYTYYTNPILVLYVRGSGTRLLEDDIVTIYGQLEGEYTYTATLNQQVTVPLFYAYFAELK